MRNTCTVEMLRKEKRLESSYVPPQSLCAAPKYYSAQKTLSLGHGIGVLQTGVADAGPRLRRRSTAHRDVETLIVDDCPLLDKKIRFISPSTGILN
jgi:hypothetical protein